METYIGLDFGGTKLLIGEMSAKGEILRSKRYPTGFREQNAAAQALLSDMQDYCKTVGFSGKPAAAGIGIVGVVDHGTGEWVSIDHQVTNPPIPLAAQVEKLLGIPVSVDNDVRSATCAELLLGHGRKTKNFIYLNVGTGLAAGVVSSGRILRGANNNSGEIGHMVIDLHSSEVCICGRKGCVENFVSGVGFTRQVQELSASYSTSLALPAPGARVDAVRLFQLADEGDPLCKAVTEQAAEALSCVIMNLVRVSDPDTVILGGGVVSDGWLLEKVRPLLNDATMRGVTNGLVLSAFQPKNAGLLGAASLGLARVLEADL